MDNTNILTLGKNRKSLSNKLRFIYSRCLFSHFLHLTQKHIFAMPSTSQRRAKRILKFKENPSLVEFAVLPYITREELELLPLDKYQSRLELSKNQFLEYYSNCSESAKPSISLLLADQISHLIPYSTGSLIGLPSLLEDFLL